MGDYETNYLKGIFNAIILFLVMGICFYAITAFWAAFTYNLTLATAFLNPFATFHAEFQGLLSNLTLQVTAFFFIMFLFIIVYIVVLPFLKVPQEQEVVGWN